VPQQCTPGAPSPEVCDGLDNNCDGQVDEGLPPLTCGVGACVRTVPACVSGVPQTCTPGAPSPETCDGVDNDCNGQVDDGVCLPPAVMCPGAMTAQAGVPLTLTATAQDLDGTTPSVSWTVSGRPAGSSANPAPPSAATTTFTPDAAGTFTLSFCATDKDGRSACCLALVATTACSSPPAPPVSTACETSWDGRPIVQFSAVPAGLTYELAAADSGLVLASATAGQNWLRPAAPVAAGSPPPGAPIALGVRACRTSDPTCCSSPTVLALSVVAPCSTPTTPTSANVLLSEYVVNGEGACPSADCATHDTCQAGEAVEITNLSNCPVSLDGHHFAYRNSNASTASMRWMNFGPADVIPPRGVYVAIRNQQYAPTCSASLGPESAALYGLKVSALSMQGPNLCNGWFNNTGGGLSEMQVAPGTVPAGSTPTFTPSAALARVAPYLPLTGSSPTCTSTGFDAVDSCGTVVGGAEPTLRLSPNQLGRLWHPCDAVVSPVPACVRN
jgi:hypothetical protein